MSDHRRALSATGLAFAALGAVIFILGLVSAWLNVRQPIAFGMVIGAGLVFSGVGLVATNRDRQDSSSGGPR